MQTQHRPNTRAHSILCARVHRFQRTPIIAVFSDAGIEWRASTASCRSAVWLQIRSRRTASTLQVREVSGWCHRNSSTTVEEAKQFITWFVCFEWPWRVWRSIKSSASGKMKRILFSASGAKRKNLRMFGGHGSLHAACHVIGLRQM